MISKSPERGSFQQERSHKTLNDPTSSEEQRQNALDSIDLFKTWREQANELENTIEWQTNNMEYDLRTTNWILEKVRNSDSYAQNLYAALCNNDFVKNDVWPILTEQKWHCSWRHAGGIVADMKEKGDYIDWYCSGIGDGLGNGDKTGTKGYVSESTVTDEIRKDLLKLGWIVLSEDVDV